MEVGHVVVGVDILPAIGDLAAIVGKAVFPGYEAAGPGGAHLRLDCLAQHPLQTQRKGCAHTQHLKHAKVHCLTPVASAVGRDRLDTWRLPWTK
jgi:hypothetical protein